MGTFALHISRCGLRHLACAAVIAAGLACALAQQIADMGAAREYCDTHPLDRIEGIWDLTDADTQVLIARSEGHDGEYVMTVITSGDCRLLPGDTLGIYRRTPDGDRFRLTMSTGLKINAECVATLTEDDMGITIQRPVHRIELSPHLLLRRFWSLFRYRSDNPADRLHDGLIRIYPPDRDQLPSPYKMRYL